jgi:hypothetical protein
LPEKNAQQSLDDWCNKNHQSMATFAEQFRVHAHKSGYSDVELICRIDAQRSRELCTVMVTFAQVTPHAVPTSWEKYLDWCLGIEMNLREEHRRGSQAAAPSFTTPRKDPNAMDVDAMRKPEKLSKEQEKWMSEGKCFRCGKHRSLKKGERCRTPTYKGYYELPARTQVRAVDEESTASEPSEVDERAEYVRKMLEKYDSQSKDKGKAPAVEIQAARIEEVTESGFLSGVL